MAALALATAYELECCGVWSKDEEISYEIKAAMNFIQAALNAADIANPFTDEARRTSAVS